MVAIFEITDGTESGTVNLINPSLGFHLESWRPAIAGLKGGGSYQDSSIAPLRNLTFGVFQTVDEVFNLKINNVEQDALIRDTQDLLRLLQKARDYWLTTWQDTPVYIKAKSTCETNTRYALIHNYSLTDIDNPYAQPFMSPGDFLTMNGLALGIERAHWQDLPPGTGECAQASSVQAWPNEAQWELTAAAPNGAIWALMQSSTGRIFATDIGAAGVGEQIIYSDDDGDNWAVSIAEPAITSCYGLIQTTTGRIITCEDNNILYSDADGNPASWNLVAVAGIRCYSFIQTPTGRIIGGGIAGDIHYSDDDGLSWTTITPLVGDVYSLLQVTVSGTTTNRIFAGDGVGRILSSDDDGITWIVSVDTGANIDTMIQTSTGRILVNAPDGVVYSDDNGASWGFYYIVTGGYRGLVQTSSGRMYISEAPNDIYFCEDDGETWQLSMSSTVASIRSMIETSTTRVLAGDTGQIWKIDTTTINMGNEAGCLDAPMVSNKQNVAQLTDIYVDDGGVWGANLIPMTAFPVALLPAAPIVNDAIYFGINTAIIASGPFSSLVFDIATIINFTSSYTITWEYWNGAAWGALGVKDGTETANGAFTQYGVRSVHWTPPTNWAAYDLSGAGGPAITGYWVRARVSALVGNMTAPAQQNRSIYTIVNSYIDIADTAVLGDIPSLARIKANNRSDEDGRGGNAPDLYDNRLIVGLRSYERGTTFQAYLNASDEQNPFGVTVTAGTNVTITADNLGPTGWNATCNPAGVEVMASRILFTLAPSIARDYYGTFHAFVRVQRTAGASTDFDVRLVISSGSGGVSTTTDTVQVQTTTAFEVLDFGQIQIPAAGSLGLTELGDQTTIDIQASAASGTPNLIIYDLILIPTDEWSIDAIDKANIADSVVGRTDDIDRLLDIDSITRPKSTIRALVREVDSDRVSAIYDPITAGEAIFQANTDQRLWFFAMTTNTTSSPFYWYAPPPIAHSIQLFKNDRYLAMRGDR